MLDVLLSVVSWLDALYCVSSTFVLNWLERTKQIIMLTSLSRPAVSSPEVFISYSFILQATNKSLGCDMFLLMYQSTVKTPL